MFELNKKNLKTNYKSLELIVETKIKHYSSHLKLYSRRNENSGTKIHFASMVIKSIQS